MPKMFFETPGCAGVTVDSSGRSYNADRHGFITAHDSDVSALKSGGYIEAGGLPHLSRFWRCEECDWEAALNHCRYCDSEDLTRVEL